MHRKVFGGDGGASAVQVLVKLAKDGFKKLFFFHLKNVGIKKCFTPVARSAHCNARSYFKLQIFFRLIPFWSSLGSQSSWLRTWAICDFLKSSASFCLFPPFQTNITIFTTNKWEKCPSSKRCWDLNPRPLEHESPSITTRPGLPTLFAINYFNCRRGWAEDCHLNYWLFDYWPIGMVVGRRNYLFDGPRWWSSGQRACHLLQWSKFECRWISHFLFCKLIKKNENKAKRGRGWFIKK